MPYFFAERDSQPTSRSIMFAGRKPIAASARLEKPPNTKGTIAVYSTSSVLVGGGAIKTLPRRALQNRRKTPQSYPPRDDPRVEEKLTPTDRQKSMHPDCLAGWGQVLQGKVCTAQRAQSEGAYVPTNHEARQHSVKGSGSSANRPAQASVQLHSRPESFLQGSLQFDEGQGGVPSLIAILKEPYAANTKVAIAGMRSSAPASTKKKRSELRGSDAMLTRLGIAAHRKGHTA